MELQCSKCSEFFAWIVQRTSIYLKSSTVWPILYGLITDRVVRYCCQNYWFRNKQPRPLTILSRKLLPAHRLENREDWSWNLLWANFGSCSLRALTNHPDVQKESPTSRRPSALQHNHQHCITSDIALLWTLLRKVCTRDSGFLSQEHKGLQ